MIPDYPAAHSMDATWFAVDQDGAIGFFDTDDAGVLPSGPFPKGMEAGHGPQALEAHELLAALLWQRGQTDGALREALPDTEAELAQALGWGLHDREQVLEALGVYVFASEDYGPLPYVSVSKLARVARVADLPARMQGLFNDAMLPVRFKDSPRVAPGEHGAVESWSGIWFDTAGKAHSCDGGEVDPDLEDEMRSYMLGDDHDGEEDGEEEGDDPIDLMELVRGVVSEHRERVSRQPASARPSVGLLGWLKNLFGG